MEAIVNELRRLQRDGVDRVFVEDDTINLITSRASEQTQRAQSIANNKDSSASATSPTRHAALDDLITHSPQKHASEKALPPAQTVSLPDAPTITLPESEPADQLAWLREQVQTCEVCQQHLSDTGKVVFGSGSHDADIFFCGEAPGTDEERTGEPSVGKAGQLLTKIITAMGLSRAEVYITNILKWRPEHDKPYGNRPPTIDEMRFCLPYLEAQIEIIKPRVIIALGNAALTGLLGPDSNRKLGSVRGTWASFKGIPVMITFHPSYLLRNGTLKTKRMAWEDMLLVMEKCELAINDKQRGYFLPKP